MSNVDRRWTTENQGKWSRVDHTAGIESPQPRPEERPWQGRRERACGAVAATVREREDALAAAEELEEEEEEEDKKNASEEIVKFGNERRGLKDKSQGAERRLDLHADPS